MGRRPTGCLSSTPDPLGQQVEQTQLPTHVSRETFAPKQAEVPSKAFANPAHLRAFTSRYGHFQPDTVYAHRTHRRRR